MTVKTQLGLDSKSALTMHFAYMPSCSYTSRHTGCVIVPRAHRYAMHILFMQVLLGRRDDPLLVIYARQLAEQMK